MVGVTEMSLLFVLFMATSASGLVIKPVSEQISEPQKRVDAVQPCVPSCPFGWVKFDGRCFNYVSWSVDWASAEAHCLNQGANLVSIHNENEYQTVKALIRAYDPKENPTWLGLNNCQKRDSWFWSDGTKFGYRKWNKEEPNHLNNECCVHMNWGVQKDWNDIPCNQPYPFVCVKRLR
ncbi:galactose-specific lectin nattectin-like isoform X2 [Colossoma macropomum]|uniref:galactose-specific lectin nattectin-like isoform X2 n=1 Tax=Colossoma macropomum TaxID=42526 RepID=UPI0018653B89|nr:galactose-specific lectin nattectin-like isoform X2 [Colossoma macropomum]